MAQETGVIDLMNSIQAPRSIELAAKEGVPPVRYVLERFLGKENPYGVNFVEPNAWKDRWPKDFELSDYSPEQLLEDVQKTAEEYNAKKPDENKLAITGAYVEDALVGYYVHGLSKGNIFCPLVDVFFVAVYLNKLEEAVSKNDSVREVIEKGVKEDFEDITKMEAELSKLGEIQNLIKEKSIVKDGYLIEEHKQTNVSNINSLISYCAGLGGKPIFEGQRTDDTGLGVLSQVPKERSLWQIFAKEGSKQKDFDTYLKYALEAEPI